MPANIVKGRTFTSGETLTPAKLNDLVDLATIELGTIDNGDISTTAGIAHTKLASLPGGQMLVGNSSNQPHARAISGDLTVSNTGVATISATAINEGKIADDAVTNAKLRNSSALSVIGNATNVSANPADITAVTDGHVLRRSGTSLGFGTITTAGITDDAVTFAKIQNSASAGMSVVGRAANSTGDFAEIAAGTDGHVLRRSGTTLGFGKLTASAFPTNFPIQIVQAVKTDTQTIDTGASNWVDVSGLSLTLTRSIASASGAVRVQAAISSCNDHGDKSTAFRIIRDSTTIGVGAAAGNRIPITSASGGNWAGTHVIESIAIDFIDKSPGTSSTVTYKIQARSFSGSTGYINRSIDDSDVGDYRYRAISTLTLTELAP